MSVHNGSRHVGESIESIRRQTLEDWHMVVVDDASTDRTLHQIYAAADDDSRITVIRNIDNIGLGAVLAREVERATTPWIARMDADDISEPFRLAEQSDYVDTAPGVDLLGSWASIIDDAGEVTGEKIVPTSESDIYRLVWTNPFVHSTVLFRRNAVIQAGNYNPQLRKRQDYDLWFRCVAAGLGMANLPSKLLRYRVSMDQYRRNDWSVVRTHLRVGLRGCALIKAPPHAYVGVLTPALRQLLPLSLRPQAKNFLERFDPRVHG